MILNKPKRCHTNKARLRDDPTVNRQLLCQLSYRPKRRLLEFYTGARPGNTQNRRIWGYFPRKVAARSRATSRACARFRGSKEMAETRGWPPPPYFSASEARFSLAVAWFHGFVPRETFARTAEALTLTE